MPWLDFCWHTKVKLQNQNIAKKSIRMEIECKFLINKLCFRKSSRSIWHSDEFWVGRGRPSLEHCCCGEWEPFPFFFLLLFYLKVFHCWCGVTFLPLPRLSILPWALPWEFFIAFHFSSSSSLILIHHVYSHIFTAEGPHSVAKKELIVFYFFSVCVPIVKVHLAI